MSTKFIEPTMVLLGAGIMERSAGLFCHDGSRPCDDYPRLPTLSAAEQSSTGATSGPCKPDAKLHRTATLLAAQNAAALGDEARRGTGENGQAEEMQQREKKI